MKSTACCQNSPAGSLTPSASLKTTQTATMPSAAPKRHPPQRGPGNEQQQDGGRTIPSAT